MMEFDQMVDLSPWWEKLRAVASQRNAQKRDFRSSKYWNADSHFMGLCGELLYAIDRGEKVDTRLLEGGDGGTDFPGGVDVKACRFNSNAYLKHPVRAKHWPEIFVLCFVDKKKKRGRILGWATAKELRDGEIKDFGYGPQYTLPQYKLMPIDFLVIKEGDVSD